MEIQANLMRDCRPRLGCFVVDDALQSRAMLDELEAAARRIVARVQSGADAYSLDPSGTPGQEVKFTELSQHLQVEPAV